jgi:cytochrome c peroxidase
MNRKEVYPHQPLSCLPFDLYPPRRSITISKGGAVMSSKRILVLSLSAALILVLLAVGASAQGTLTDKEALGKALFFDENLSLNSNQSCATCHAPEAGWTGPHADINLHGAVYEGSIPGAFGDRKPPTAAYGGASPLLYYDARAGVWVGGMFWDGRATGWTLGDPLAEQAQGPFLNPVEQALPDAEAVIAVVKASDYKDLFNAQCDPQGTGTTAELYNCVGYAIAAYERSAEVNPFTSKYDYWLRGEAKLTPEEHLGRALFQGKAKCSACHLIKGKQPLFTDFTYDNLGIPMNPENPVYTHNPDFVDPGLGGFLKSAGYDEATYMAEWGKHKVPTLRNVDQRPYPEFVKAYGHNGYFKSLEGITHFYNTRDIKPACPGDYTEAEALAANCWPKPEVAVNVNAAEMGNLGLSPREEAAIVAFMKTLTDGWKP